MLSTIVYRANQQQIKAGRQAQKNSRSSQVSTVRPGSVMPTSRYDSPLGDVTALHPILPMRKNLPKASNTGDQYNAARAHPISSVPDHSTQAIKKRSLY